MDIGPVLGNLGQLSNADSGPPLEFLAHRPFGMGFAVVSGGKCGALDHVSCAGHLDALGIQVLADDPQRRRDVERSLDHRRDHPQKPAGGTPLNTVASDRLSCWGPVVHPSCRCDAGSSMQSIRIRTFDSPRGSRALRSGNRPVRQAGRTVDGRVPSARQSSSRAATGAVSGSSRLLPGLSTMGRVNSRKREELKWFCSIDRKAHPGSRCRHR